jgi:hypothetical protein
VPRHLRIVLGDDADPRRGAALLEVDREARAGANISLALVERREHEVAGFERPRHLLGVAEAVVELRGALV